MSSVVTKQSKIDFYYKSIYVDYNTDHILPRADYKQL